MNYDSYAWVGLGVGHCLVLLMELGLQFLRSQVPFRHAHQFGVCECVSWLCLLKLLLELSALRARAKIIVNNNTSNVAVVFEIDPVQRGMQSYKHKAGSIHIGSSTH